MRRSLFFVLIPVLIFSQGIRQETMYSLKFDGGDDYVKLSHSVVYDNGLTYEVIYKAIEEKDQVLYTEARIGAITGHYMHIISPLNKVSCGVVDENITTYGVTSTALSLNTWYFATLVGKVGDSLRLYVNGSLNAKSSVILPSIRDMPCPKSIGAILDNSDNPSKVFNGYIKEVRVYKRALSPSEVQWNYTHYPHIYDTSGLVLWIKGDTKADTVIDYSGKNNHGIMYNGVIKTAIYPKKIGVKQD